jgi:hypothetical protein
MPSFLEFEPYFACKASSIRQYDTAGFERQASPFFERCALIQRLQNAPAGLRQSPG